MQRARPNNTNLALLVDRLAAFLHKQAADRDHIPRPAGIFPGDLQHLYDTLWHHLVILMLVARSDDTVAPTEREAVLQYGISRAEDAGQPLTSAQKAALSDYLRSFQPTNVQLGPALERVKQDAKNDVAALLDSAHAVVSADGVTRLQEALFLSSLKHDLAAL